MNDDSLFTFAEEIEQSPSDPAVSGEWLVLSVEDDPGYQQSLELGLRGLTVNSLPIRLLTASSAAQAAAIIAEHDDIAVILLDVVMEHDDAGLFLVNTIRNVLGNELVRIILLTGQPGMAPRLDTMRDFDVDEYWNKVDLTAEKLRSVVTSNIKTWDSLHELAVAKRGLQLIVDASRSITARQEIHSFSDTVLKEITRIIGVDDSGGVACIHYPQSMAVSYSPIVASSGEFADNQAAALSGLLTSLEETEQQLLSNAIDNAITQREHQFADHWTVLYFSTQELDDRRYLIIVKSAVTLQLSHITLLMVFSQNIGNGFTNLALLNKLTSLAYYDTQLAIPNRNWLERELNTTSQEDKNNSIILLFRVNDFFTNEIMLGSEFMRAMMASLLDVIRAQVPGHYAIARLDEDCLAMLIHKPDAPDKNALLALTEQSVVVNEITHKMLLSVAYMDLSLVARENAEQAIRLSEATLHEANRHGELVRFYNAELLQALENRYTLLKHLRDAITEGDQLRVYYQPKFNMHTGKVCGAEALVRWQYDADTLLAPDQFIPLAETSGLITKIDTRVMETVFADVARLQSSGFALPVSFNVSNLDLLAPEFLGSLESLLLHSKLTASLFEIEITETQAMQNYEAVAPVLSRLVKLGVKISIDDFGTGYSSLAHFTKLAATVLKVDKSFVAQLAGKDKENALAVIKMVRNFAEQFGAIVVAEGIETEEQRAILTDNGYQIGQGYLFSRPIPFSQFETLLAQEKQLTLSR
ncbi:putative bifunctional diguanylate cyclase/phosphodiesterase [Salinimonas sediminis]|uniref:EAL domain-containing protein n=1 Tax=Salinimonas sediminis TaxID=2303538 RepID=A0A346NQB3_9ALTE|nr:EAL domain-containing protein [Salinimonas sediminis]AXR07720.1 EAL domain-containing protein [Salinimonas sediminis]